MINNRSNARLLKEFDKRVIGHTKAKKMLISLVNRSKTASYYKNVPNNPTDAIETMNCMLIGGSGTGKTHLVNVLKDLVDFPLIRVDATQLNPAGAKGDGAEDILKDILEQAKELAMEEPEPTYIDVQNKIDQTIVFIDEVDKISTSFESNGDGNWNKQTQATLLNLFENNEMFKNVSYILAGAFVGLQPRQEKRITIGFNKEDEVEEVKEITDRDVINFGMMPELIGRLSGVMVLDTLEYDDMKKILYDAVLPEKIKQLERFMQIPEDIISEEQEKSMIERALSSGQGARSLKREVNNLFADLEFNYEFDIRATWSRYNENV